MIFTNGDKQNILIVNIFKVLEVIKFRFTNWTDPEDGEQLFQSLSQITSESQYDCPVDEVATELSRSFPVFRSLFKRCKNANPFINIDVEV